MKFARSALMGTAVVASFVAAAPAGADIVLSELIVELQPGKQTRDDIEVWNNSSDRAFVAVEPREIINPGLPGQSARQDPDPEKFGILVNPARMILEGGQRKLIRIAAITPSPDHERVYRVTVKPVAGTLQSGETGLKIMVGYDVLVLVRPAAPAANVVAIRTGRTITFENKGNVSVEAVDGKQCTANKGACTALPGKRLYPGVSWTVELPADLPTEYTLRSPGRADRRIF